MSILVHALLLFSIQAFAADKPKESKPEAFQIRHYETQTLENGLTVL